MTCSEMIRADDDESNSGYQTNEVNMRDFLVNPIKVTMRVE